MLKLIDPVRFSNEEQSYIDTTLKPLGKDGWTDNGDKTNSIKHHISKHTIIAQRGRCAYCEAVLAKGDVEIEHIAPRKHYGMFTFEPYNLVSSCGCCNAPRNKGQNKTIADPVNAEEYDANSFIIVHPFFDDPDNHLKYVDEDSIIIDYDKCSKKGKKTVDMFHWNETWAVYKRAAIAYMRQFPIDVLKLAAEISTYK